MVDSSKFHGSTPFNVDIPLMTHEFATDACLVGGAGHYKQDWFYTSWSEDFPQLSNANINVLELKTVLVAAKRWGPLWRGSHVLVRSDNFATVAAINNTTTRSSELLVIVKELFWLSVEHNFRLSAKHLPGILNVFSDHLSRMHDVSSANNAHCLLLGSTSSANVYCQGKMTYGAFMSLQRSWAVDWSY
jgi:hypothetical protein